MTQSHPPPSPEPNPSSTDALEAPQRTVFSGVRWHSLGAGSVQVSRLLIALVLANWLGTDLFGLVASVQLVVGFADYFKDAGLGQAIVRRKKLEPSFLSTVFYANLAMGASVSLVIWFLSPVIADWLQEPRIAGVLPVLGLSAFITSTGVVQRNLYARMMRFDRLAMANFLNAAVYGVSALTLAWLDYGIWSIVWGTLMGHIVGNGVLWVHKVWRPQWAFEFRFLRETFGFCVGVLGSNLTSHFLSNVDRLVVQVVMGTSALGSYAIAARLVTFPAQNLGRMLTAVMLPAFSRLQEDLEEYRLKFIRSCAGIAMLTCPMMAGLMAVAPILVTALFSKPEWEAAIPLIIVMGPLGMVLAISLPLHAIYVSLGRSLELLFYGVLFGIVSLEAYLIGSLHGAIGVAIAGTLTHLIMAHFYFTVPLRFIHLRVRTLVLALVPYFVTSTVMGLVVWRVRIVLESWEVDPRINLALCVILGALLYGGAMWRMQTQALQDLLRFVGKRRAVKGRSTEAES
ncbi:MAG: lipopolysaccharide biosynthesis protein [bacterium]|nr:lipopolysaccharide biosynthesis protein [bacterium]